MATATKTAVICPECKLPLEQLRWHGLTYTFQDVDVSDPDNPDWDTSESKWECEWTSYYTCGSCGAVVPDELAKDLPVPKPDDRAQALLEPMED